MSKKIIKNIKGVTLLVLVITIIVLLILAAVVANLALSDGGILDEARRAAKEWNETTDKEQSDLSKLAKEMRNARNGIYNGTGSNTGNETGENEGGDVADKDSQIADLENTVSNLEETIDDLNNQLEQEKANKEELENRITDLNNRVDELEREVEQGNATIAEKQGAIDNLNTELAAKNEELENKTNTITSLEGTVASLNKQIENLNTQIANLTKKQATGNATAGDVLASKTFSNSSSVGLTGTMVNRGTLNWSGSNTTYTVQPGYYSGGTIDSRPSYNAGVNAGYNSRNKFTLLTQSSGATASGVSSTSINVAADTGKDYYIFTVTARNNVKIDSLIVTPTTNNGTLTKIVDELRTGDTIAIRGVWKLEKSNTASASTLTFTSAGATSYRYSIDVFRIT